MFQKKLNLVRNLRNLNTENPPIEEFLSWKSSFKSALLALRIKLLDIDTSSAITIAVFVFLQPTFWFELVPARTSLLKQVGFLVES